MDNEWDKGIGESKATSLCELCIHYQLRKNSAGSCTRFPHESVAFQRYKCGEFRTSLVYPGCDTVLKLYNAAASLRKKQNGLMIHSVEAHDDQQTQILKLKMEIRELKKGKKGAKK